MSQCIYTVISALIATAGFILFLGLTGLSFRQEMTSVLRNKVVVVPFER